MAEVQTADSAEVLARLRDLHLPELPEVGILADWAAGMSIGLLVSLVLLLLLRRFVRRLPSQREAALKALAACRTLEPAERLLAQARILQSLASKLQPASSGEMAGAHWSVVLEGYLKTDFFSAGPGKAFHEDLYRPVLPADPEALERALLPLLKRVRV